MDNLIQRTEDRLAEQRRARAAAAADGDDLGAAAIGIEIGETRRALDALRASMAGDGPGAIEELARISQTPLGDLSN